MSFKHYGTYQEATKDIRFVSGVHMERLSPRIELHFEEGAGALNSWVPQPLVTTETGTGTPWAPNATAGSYIVGATGATTNNGEEVAGKKVGWNPSTMGGISLVVRAKFVGTTTATDGDFTIGFADAVTYTNSLPYVVSAASAFTTSVPSEFAGFYYSSIPTSGALYGASGNPIGFVTTKANADTATAPTVATVKDSSFHLYRLDIDSTGTATFYIDGVLAGVVASAVTANTEFTPYIDIVAKNSHVHTGTVDLIGVYAGTYV